MSQTNPSLSLANPHPPHLSLGQKIFTAIGSFGLLLLFIAWLGSQQFNIKPLLYPSLCLMAIGVMGYAWLMYKDVPAGIKNNGNYFSGLTNRGLWAWIAGIIITGFYVLLYFYEGLLGFNEAGNTGLVQLFDPLSFALKGKAASQWFVYGTLYTLAILIFGVKFMLKYRHNRYQIIRTISVIISYVFSIGFCFFNSRIVGRLKQR